MKMFSRILSLLIITSLGLIYAGCGGGGGDGDPVAKQQLTKLEKKTWTINSVSFTGTGGVEDRKADFNGATFTVSGSYTDGGTYNYTWAGTMPSASSPWKRTGTFKFVGDAKTQIIRPDDNIVINYTVTDSQLTMVFNFSGDGYAPGRIAEVDGAWSFTLN